MLEAIFVQPIFNLLVVIYALLPGHNFGLALILFTIVVRLALWPLVRKQLHNAKAQRELMPELKKIKQRAKGNKLLERQLTLELYKEREINPFSSLGIALVQLPILIGLYVGLSRVVKNHEAIVEHAYSFVRNLDWMQQLSQNIKLFDDTLLGFVNLTRPAIGPKGFYLPAFIIVVAAVLAQYYQSKQIMPTPKDGRKLREIFKDAGEGKQADQEEVTAAVNRTMMLFLPFMIFIFTIGIASALSLYILVGALVAVMQQSYILRKDVDEVDGPIKDANSAIEGEVIDPPKQKTTKTKSAKKSKKRRK